MDNFFQNCPAMMNDGFRDITDYQTATRRNEYIRYVNDIYRDDQYRLFLQLNGKKILDREWEYDRKNHSCWDNACVHRFPLRQTTTQFIEERQAYDSIFDPKTNAQLAPMRACKKYPDYRLNPQ